MNKDSIAQNGRVRMKKIRKALQKLAIIAKQNIDKKYHRCFAFLSKEDVIYFTFPGQ